ncbi:MAG: hypothetical protein EOM69_06375 [Clostridia bacterium]|nr:hypothetical protein [Clostridia bacterium]
MELRQIAGVDFLVFEGSSLSPEAWEAVCAHSSICFAALVEGELLRPLALRSSAFFPAELAQILKYKGKTNPDFTGMMLHCARSASRFALQREPLTVLDPLCGRGTTLLCALSEGYNTVGIELDSKAIAETDAFLTRYLQHEKRKYKREALSRTLRTGGNISQIRYTVSDCAEHYKQGEVRSLSVLKGDSALADEMIGSSSCHLIVGDLPYGVQHAPKEGKRLTGLEALLERTLPAYYRALKPGGAIALAFNVYTLSRRAVTEQMTRTGFTVLDQEPYQDFEHWVEQAVNRDMVVALR